MMGSVVLPKTTGKALVQGVAAIYHRNIRNLLTWTAAVRRQASVQTGSFSAGASDIGDRPAATCAAKIPH
jgi:hypothetical protein